MFGAPDKNGCHRSVVGFPKVTFRSISCHVDKRRLFVWARGRKRTIFGSHCRVADDLHSYRARATDAAESVFVGSLRSCSEFSDLIIHDVRAPGETGQSGKHTRYLRLNKGLGGF